MHKVKDVNNKKRVFQNSSFSLVGKTKRPAVFRRNPRKRPNSGRSIVKSINFKFTVPHSRVFIFLSGCALFSPPLCS
jgi:hypothetical protein